MTLYPIKRANTAICLKKLKSYYFSEVGKPERVLSDHGMQFTSPSWKLELEAEGVDVIFSSIRHPQSNPSERIMRELGRFFRTYCAERHASWARFVPRIQDCINLSCHQSTESVPYELHYGRAPRDKLVEMFPKLKSVSPSQEIQVKLAREKLQKSWYRRQVNQKTVCKIKYEVGDLVLLRVPHLSDA